MMITLLLNTAFKKLSFIIIIIIVTLGAYYEHLPGWKNCH